MNFVKLFHLNDIEIKMEIHVELSRNGQKYEEKVIFVRPEKLDELMSDGGFIGEYLKGILNTVKNVFEMFEE